MVQTVEHTAQVSRVQAGPWLLKVSELVKGRAYCHKTLIATNIQMAVLLKVRSALCAGEGPCDVVNALAPAR